MKKTKFETFIQENDLIAEIMIKKDSTSLMLYKDTDLYLYSEYAPTLNEAIEKAVNRYLKMNKK